MKKKVFVRGLLIVIALAALCACAWCVWYIVQYYQGQSFGKSIRDMGPESGTEVPLDTKSIKIPVDFDKLREINPDIYAWIEIPGTDISYAVLHRAGDNAFYTNHSEDGAYYSGGSIYSEDYNATDFSDATVFDEHRSIYVYLPDRVLVYEIFAAYPHSNEHLLATYDFSNRAQYQAFFAEVFSTRSMEAQFLEDGMPDFDEHRVLTLSTCYRGDNHQRFLVQGRLIAEIPGK